MPIPGRITARLRIAGNENHAGKLDIGIYVLIN